MGSLAAVAAAAFHAADPAAALLLLPFVGWTCFATALVNCALASGNAEVLATLMFAPAVVICTGLLSSAQRPSVAHWHAPASAFKRRCSLPAHIDLLPKGSMMRDACSRSKLYADVAAKSASVGTGAPSEEPDLAGHATPGACRWYATHRAWRR